MRIVTLIIVFMCFNVSAQTTKTDIILTNAECGDCKERIEGKLNYTKGVKFAELNYESKELVVRYKTKHISLDEIRKIVNQIGYDADHTKADPAAQKALPLCCQPGGMKGQ